MALACVVALLVLGPRELPRVLKTLGALTRKARDVAHEFRTSLDMSVDLESPNILGDPVERERTDLKQRASKRDKHHLGDP